MENGIMPISYKSLGASSKIQKTAVIKSTQSWTVPADVTSVDIVLCGGGAGGMAGFASSWSASGGSGSADIATLAVTPGSSYTITIGAGGPPSMHSPGELPVKAGDSSFGNLFTVEGAWSWGTWGTTTNNNLFLYSGKPGGKCGGQGARRFNPNNQGADVSGPEITVLAQTGIPEYGVGGGGGAGSHSWNLGKYSSTWMLQHGVNGGGRASLAGHDGSSWNIAAGSAGEPNTGGGGGGGAYTGTGDWSAGHNGGSGICIIKYWSAL